MSQSQAILRHLRIHGSITPIEALSFYGSMRLAARVGELRRDGHAIRTETMRTRSGKRHAKYRLVDRPRQAEMPWAS